MKINEWIFYIFQVIGYGSVIAIAFAGLLSWKEKRRSARFGTDEPHSKGRAIRESREMDASVLPGKETRKKQKAAEKFIQKIANTTCEYDVKSPLFERYYIDCLIPETGKKYTNFEADFIVRLTCGIAYKNGRFCTTYNRIKSYGLQTFYWPNGGRTEFNPCPTIPLDEPTPVTASNTHSYVITFKGKKVAIPRNEEEITRYNRLDKHKNAALHTIKKTLDGAEVNIPSLVDSIAGFHKEINDRMCDILNTKPHRAPIAANELRYMSKVLYETERKLKTLEYQQMIYETIFPQLKTFQSFKKNELERLLKSELTEDARAVLTKAEDAALEILNKKTPPKQERR